ncbi:gustatory receptor 5a for trehalose-like [Plodia interpunctella]|uniref:gustatory receptor 5a for trehalose-like n=1 Tax=Plodia interpunctella TaxID=58824 RepID=UPI0023688871|nr:gustatory receptor 5a for trehalose-like [Plodia interpunctella]
MSKVNKLFVNQNSEYSEVYQCFRFGMRMCRWAGFFPVEGLDKPTISGLRYNLKGFYIIYYVATIVVGSLSAILTFLWLLENDLTLITVSDCIFSMTGFFSMFMMAGMARDWPVFMRKMTEIEHHLQEIRTSKNTITCCNIMTSSVMIAALVEHVLSVIYIIYLTKQCMSSSTELYEILMEYFVVIAPYYLQHLPYNHVAGFIFKIVNIQVTFLWSFTDVLIICFSIYLISYFQDLNKVINKRRNDSSWEQLRVHYSRVEELVMQVNEQLRLIILQSFVTYIFYICTQLFHTLKTSQSRLIDCDKDKVDIIRHSPEYLTYYVFSFVFLVLRFVVTSLLAANVSLVAKKPLTALDLVPSSEYGLEVRRFRLQIEYTPVAMSGLFFYVTRPMLLQVVGSIITYELVMLQLH